MTNTKTMNATDITDLTDAALDVFLRVKSGEDCVTVDHLSPVERQSVCDALQVKASMAWLCGTSELGADAPCGPRAVGAYAEDLILDRQAAFFDNE